MDSISIPQTQHLYCVSMRRHKYKHLTEHNQFFQWFPLYRSVKHRNYIRHGTTNLYAALDAASGKVITQTKTAHRAVEFISFLDLIDKEVPKDLEVHLILDNYVTHKTDAVRKWNLEHERFHFHFTPTYSSWMNLIERCSLN